MQFRDTIWDNYRIRKEKNWYELLRVFKGEWVMDSMWNAIYATELRPVLIFKDLREFEGLVLSIRKLTLQGK